MQKAYVDFAMDCFRPQAENQAILSNGDVPYAAASRPVGYRGGPGKNLVYFSPGGCRFLSPSRKEQCMETARFGVVPPSKPGLFRITYSPKTTITHLCWGETITRYAPAKASFARRMAPCMSLTKA